MNLPDGIQKILHTLRAAGYETCLVGGCVREMLRGAAPADYDMATAARPERVMELFGAQAHPTGLAHGTVTVCVDGAAAEITTFRCDGSYTDARHPDGVRFSASLTEDLARRDFTVNAMALDAQGRLVDPFGGEEDLRRGILRCVGEPARRFDEDALRILRLLRFCAVLGFAAEEETARAAHAARERLRLISHERVFAELSRLLCGENAAQVLLDGGDILAVVLPEIGPCIGFDQRNRHHCFDVWGHTARAVGAVAPVPVLRWTMLLHDLGKPATFTIDEAGVGHYYGHTAVSAELAEGIMRRLRFPRALRDGVRRQLACFDDYVAPERVCVHRAMAALGRETVGLLLQTKMADNAAKAPAGLARAQQPWREAMAHYDALCAEGACCAVSELAISGREVAALGYSGAQIGQVLEKLLDEVAAEELENGSAALLARANRLRRSGFLMEE